MISPSKQGRIQIEITNACPHRCSNCTRFTAHIQKPFFMAPEVFQQAVDSMHGYGGMLGIMGGEPTIHPQFAELVEYYRDNWYPRLRPLRWGRYPIDDFGEYHANVIGQIEGKKRGLWTSLGPGYYKHFELIQDTFPYQCINDHQNTALHQALLITREELKLPDWKWRRLRDKCWIQNLWSGSITPKGAFFCDIAAALDMLYGGPGGWPIEPGWWKRTPDDFKEQLQWCEICGGALPTKHRLASEEIQDISPRHYFWLQNSPAIQKGAYEVFDPLVEALGPQPSKTCDSDWYMPEQDKAERAAYGIKCLSPKYVEAVTVCVDLAHQLRLTLPRNIKQVDRWVVVTASHDLETQRLARKYGAILVISDRCYENGDAFNKGKMTNEGLKHLKLTDWLLITDADIFLPQDFRQNISRLILNPGCLYYTRRVDLPKYQFIPNHPADYHRWEDPDPATNSNPWGYFQLVNVRAAALKSLGKRLRLPEIFCSAGTVDHWFSHLWDRRKRILLPQDDGKFAAYHLYHGDLWQRWNGVRGASNGGWSYGGSTFIDAHWLWPKPCELRRIDVMALEEEIIIWDGGRPKWSEYNPSTFYEYSYKGI